VSGIAGGISILILLSLCIGAAFLLGKRRAEGNAAKQIAELDAEAADQLVDAHREALEDVGSDALAGRLADRAAESRKVRGDGPDKA